MKICIENPAKRYSHLDDTLPKTVKRRLKRKGEGAQFENQVGGGFFKMLVLLELFCFGMESVHAQVALRGKKEAEAVLAGPAAVAISRANHETVWGRVVSTPNEHGQVTLQTNVSYIELGTGLNRMNRQTGQWEASQPAFEVNARGWAEASRLQHGVKLAPNLNQKGSVELEMPDGKKLVSHPMGLSFYDAASGNNVLIAEVKDCVGQLVSSNVVIYPDAFTDLKGAIRYTVSCAGLEQDVILYERVSPQEYGLGESSRLEMYTEFENSPEPRVKKRELAKGLEDENIDFAAMKMELGKAFVLDGAKSSVPVGKSWQVLSGRTFLIESVPYIEVKPFLKDLPAPVENAAVRKASSRAALVAEMKAKAVEKEVAQIRRGAAEQRMGLVLDYNIVNGNQTNYVFRGDSTYYVSSACYLYGTTVIEGNTVVKYPETNSVTLTVASPEFRTGQYRPAIFTSMNDDSVGETISGSSGSPAKGTATYLILNSTVSPVKCVRMRYAACGISGQGAGNIINIYHSQFIKCGTVVYGGYPSTVNLYNVLFSQCLACCSAYSVTAVQVTADQNSIFNPTFSPVGLYACILTYTPIANQSSYYSIVTNAPGIYQSMGAGSYYLADDSSCRNAGSIAMLNLVAPGLVNDLKVRTTYPPVVYSNQVFAASQTWVPRAQRDTDTPDLGYHYDPIDYIADNLTVTNATLTLTNGVAVAGYNRAGILLQDRSSIVSVGSPLYPNWLVRYSSVQEQAVAFSGLPGGGISVLPCDGTETWPSGQYRFAKFAMPAGGGVHLWHDSWVGADLRSYQTLLVQDCEFWGGINYLTGPKSLIPGAVLKNNLFDRSSLWASRSLQLFPGSLCLSNNLVRGTYVQLIQISGPPWRAYNNAFDNCSGDLVGENNHNAYINSTISFYSGTNNVVLSSFDYASGPLGNYYQLSTNLVNMGSVTADLTGLYHYTTQTNQVKEAASQVDIGYHYVAVNTTGSPADLDGDGLPDYLEDSNGDGVFNGGDFGNWQSYDSANKLSGGNPLQVFTPLK